MKSRRKIVIKIIIAVVAITLVVSFVLPIAYSPWAPIGFFVMANQANRMRVRLLCKTDHQVILEACREVLRRGDLKPGLRYQIRDAQHHQQEVSRLPQPILDLAPSYVLINDMDGHIRLEMYPGGMDSFGVRAYPFDFNKPYLSYSCGDKELIEGLWYYDIDYEGNPKHQKWIEELLQKRK